MIKIIKSKDDHINVFYDNVFLQKTDADRYYKILLNINYNSDDDSKIKIFGKYITIPRKQVAYGDPNTFYTFSNTKVSAINWHTSDVGSVLLEIKNKVEKYTKKKYNFVLINKYRDGSDSIGWHSDDEVDIDPKMGIASISFGAARIFKFRSKLPQTFNIDKNFKLSLAHGSLLVMRYPTNKYWQHSLPKSTIITKPRINLTFRCIKN